VNGVTGINIFSNGVTEGKANSKGLMVTSVTPREGPRAGQKI
jgi:hypothetical protein